VSSLYTPVPVVYVLVAVLGLGLIASVAVVAATARKVGRGSTDIGVARPLVSTRRSALVTGGLPDIAAGRTFHEASWFRGSALLLVVTGVLHAQARRAVQLRLAKEDSGDAVLRRVERIVRGVCALTAAITVLMEVKPC
jgi:hypothetical protein